MSSEKAIVLNVTLVNIRINKIIKIKKDVKNIVKRSW